MGEQVVAGVVLSERLAATMYGAVYRMRMAGQRNLRGLVVGRDLAANDAFRCAVTDATAIQRIASLSHASIAATLRVETADRSIVVVTRGSGNQLTLQDLLVNGGTRHPGGGRLGIPIAASIAKSVIEALAAAHAGGVIHGALHPQSIAINGDGTVQLDHFVVAQGVTAAFARGTELSPWSALADYFAPEVAAGAAPSPSNDLYGVGAILFAMIVGQPPPGGLHATPGLERLIRRALDADPQRRYDSASELLDGLCEAMEDDRWAFAAPSELALQAGLSDAEGDVEDATEDLLASLADAPAPKPSLAFRATARSATDVDSDAALDAVLDDVGEQSGDGDEAMSLPAEQRPQRTVSPLATAPALPAVSAAALAPTAISATSAIAAAPPAFVVPPVPVVAAVRSVPLVPLDLDESPPRLKSRLPGVLGLIAIGFVGYFVYHQYTHQQDLDAAAAEQANERKRAAAEAQRTAVEDLPDPGTIRVTSNPPQAGVWLKIGRTPVTSLAVSSAMMHELRFEGVDGYDPVDTQVVAAHWSGSQAQRTAAIAVDLPRAKVDPHSGKPAPAMLPAMPPKPPASAETGFSSGRGAMQITSTPPGAEVWMYIGMTNGVELSGIQSGLPYELRLLADGYLPGFISVTADEWRSGGDRTVPINRAHKREILEKSLDLISRPSPKSKAAQKPGRGG